MTIINIINDKLRQEKKQRLEDKILKVALAVIVVILIGLMY